MMPPDQDQSAGDAPAGPPAVPRRSILFVCTGNTCRSPLAEAICKRRLADRLGVPADELERHGFVVRSAGVAAWGGDPANPVGVEVAREYGADLSGHQSRPVNPELLAGATDVIAMTAGHAAALFYGFPGHGPPPVLLCDDGDLDDPIGGDVDVYRACAADIARHLDRFLPGWLGS